MGEIPIIRDIIAIAQTPAPTFAEEPRLAWLEHRLRGAPGTRSRDAAGNLIWRLADGPVELLVLAHVDTVFDAATPLRVTEGDGYLEGAGVGDNAAAIAVILAVAPAFAGLPLAVAFTVGEEGLGNLSGALHACATLAPAMALAVEGHGLESVFVDAVGSVRARLAVEGPGGHSWWDRGRPSAIHALASLVTVLVSEGSVDAPVNVGLIEGGKAVNAIAARASALVEARSLEPALLADFETMLGDLRLAGGLELDVEILGRRPAGRMPRDHALLAAVRATRIDLGLPAGETDGSTDANAALQHRIPALALGCAYGHDMHSVRERIDPASVEVGRAQLEGVLRRLLPRTQEPR